MEITEKIKDIAEGVGDKIGEGIEYVKRESAEGGKIDAFMDKVGEKLSDAKEVVGEKFTDAKEAVADKVSDIKDKFDGEDDTDKCCCAEKPAEDGDECCADKSAEEATECCCKGEEKPAE